jgi:hypothetical protein
MKRVKRAGFMVVGGGLVCYLIAVLIGTPEKRRLRERMDDVRMLTHICQTYTNIHTTDDLYSTLEQLGLKLHNTVAEDRSKRCYRLVNAFPVGGGDSNSPLSVNATLIEETNSVDSGRVVRSTMDGMVFVQSRKEKGAVKTIDTNSSSVP